MKLPSDIPGSLPSTGIGTRVISRTVETDVENSGDWFCFRCRHLVARDRDRFSYKGRSLFSFTNPVGVTYEILTFSSVSGCLESGEPTFEYTWFPDHSWSFCLCAVCRTHLGWKFHGAEHFAGLILDHLIRTANKG